MTGVGQLEQAAAMAWSLVARGDTRQAHHVAAMACAVGRWITVLELVLLFEPSALRALTELVSADIEL